MKIDLNAIDRENFMVHEHIVNGEVMYLVQPIHIGAKWTKENKIFRSSVWNADGELVSAGFPKFTNWGEAPEVFPLPTNLKGCTIMEKLDGSLLIVSKYKGNFILRTRGTVDASKMDNGFELEIFKQKYPGVFTYQPHYETWPFSLLFEWTSPLQKIVVSYGDAPEWNLVGCVAHEASELFGPYWLYQQDWLDALAKGFGCPRPATYTFSTVEDLMQNVEQWKGKEGVVIYSNYGQILHKVKGAWYLALHHMKSEFSNIEKVMDFWLTNGKPDYGTFWQLLCDVDFEIANQCRGFVSQICDGYKEVEKIVAHMKGKVECLRNYNPTFKDDKKVRGTIAKEILSAYGNTNRSSFAFKLLDGKELGDDDVKKLLFQVLK